MLKTKVLVEILKNQFTNKGFGTFVSRCNYSANKAYKEEFPQGSNASLEDKQNWFTDYYTEHLYDEGLIFYKDVLKPLYTYFTERQTLNSAIAPGLTVGNAIHQKYPSRYDIAYKDLPTLITGLKTKKGDKRKFVEFLMSRLYSNKCSIGSILVNCADVLPYTVTCDNTTFNNFIENFLPRSNQPHYVYQQTLDLNN